MSSYRNNYVSWKGSSGLGSSSYSPASSTSSLASSTSSTSNKYTSSSLSASNYKSSDSRVPSREPSFVGGSGTSSSTPSSSTATNRLCSRYSALSSKADNISPGGNASSSFGSSNLSAGLKSNLAGPSSSTSKDNNKSGLSHSYGLASVSALSSKFSTSSDQSSTSSLRNTGSSASSSSSNSYLRSNPTTTSETGAQTKPKLSSASEISSPNTNANKPLSGSLSSSSSTTAQNIATKTHSDATSYNSSGSSYRPYSTRTNTLAVTPELSSSLSSALRTTARFGLKSGASHAHYNSMLPSASTLKAAAALAEETKKEMHKAERKLILEDTGPVTWKSRGTCTNLDEQSNDTSADITNGSEIISLDETPNFNPRVFSPRYDGVLKQKGIQTEEEPKPKNFPSSIPRPTLSLNYYSGSSYGSSSPVGKYVGGTKNPAGQNQDQDCNNESKSSAASSNLKIKARMDSSSSGLNNSKDNNATPPEMTSDQSSRSSQQTINNKIAAVESSGICNNEHEPIAKTTTNSTNEDHNNNNSNNVNTKASAATPVIITVANKEFRKSALNVGLGSKDAEEEFTRKQEELRLLKSTSKIITPLQKDCNNATKRDQPRRPPIDPNKSNNVSNNSASNQSIISATTCTLDNQEDKNSSATIAKIKPSKSINQLRKLSGSSESESCSSLSTASTVSKTSVGKKKVKKTSLSNIHNLDNKVQGRRGSATSSSSTASSRSNSVERSIHYNNNSSKNISSLKTGNNSNLSNCGKPPIGSLSASIKTDSSNSLSKSKSCKKVISKKSDDDKACSSSSKESETTKSQPKKSPTATTSTEVPAQTSFLDRVLKNDKPWVRKCQSGELPWWMKSSPDVPASLANSSSRSSVSKQDAAFIKAKQQNENETDASSDEEESEMETNNETNTTDSESVTKELGERTAPDGIEVPSEIISPKSTLHSQKTANANNKSCSVTNNESKSRKDSLFIGSVANIDEILGSVSPSLIAETPSPAPTPTPQLIDDICEAQRKLKINKLDSDEESSSDASLSSEEEEDELNKTGFSKHKNSNKESDLEDSSDEDDASTGTSSSFEEVDPCSVQIETPALKPQAEASGNCDQMLQRRRSSGLDAHSKLISLDQQKQLDDATLQLYKDGEFGTYLDLESSITEQHEDFEGFLDNRKNSIVLRAQLPVRVHAIIEKLLTADGRELRRALFSLKQIFQEDKDLVHEFVENGGLSCLIKVGSEADQNYQNYILRAIGQVMLYVDGMYGVMQHNETIQWLYNLVASKFRLVQKTALKLLLVFVDYVETNCLLLVQAVANVDNNKGLEAWSNVMNLLREQDSNSGDTELLVYAMTLVNKVLNAIPDIETYYDQVDALEEQGMANTIQSYMGKQCADLDLLKQFQIYELVLKHEDGEEDNIKIMMQLDENMRNKLLSRKGNESDKDRRKSRRHSTTTPPTTPNGTIVPPFPRRLSSADVTPRDSPFSSLSSSSSLGGTMNGIPNGQVKDKCNLELTPGLRRRRERSELQKNLILDQLGNGGINGDFCTSDPDSPPVNSESPEFISLRQNSLELQNNLKNTTNGTAPASRPWMLPIYTKSNSSANIVNGMSKECEEGDTASEQEKIQQLKRENTVKDLTQKLASQNLLASPAEENKSFINTGELSGVVLKAKEGLAKSKSRADMKPQPSDGSNGVGNNKGIQLEVKKSDNELHWDFLVNNLQRPLEICDLDFTDLKDSDDEDILAPDQFHMNGWNGHPPPVPVINGHPPPPPPSKYGGAPPPPMNGFSLTSPLFGVSLKSSNQSNTNSSSTETKVTTPKKTKKTVKLFWKEVRDDPVTVSKVEKVGCIWSEILPTPIDTQKLEHLFESRAKELINKKQSDVNKTKEIVVLDPKRSNAINIGMTKLPPPRTIKAAIMKMDSTIINREGIEKLLAMLPTEEERAKITEAQFANPETPLGSAEQFLLTLSSVSELTSRLKLWAFKLDYDNLEREVAEPLFDLKSGVEDLEKNKTFRYILATLLSIGNFLNGGDAKGFHIEYLSKVPEVKDTVQKHSLLHHLCQTVNENFPDSTDLYSEIGPVTRASRVDFDEITANLAKMENDCKISWDHLRVIGKHDGPTNLKLKLSEFLADCAERIIVLGMIHRRIMNRFRKFLLWLGVSAHQVTTTKPQTLFKVISEFALEYRTTRERVIQQLQKKASHRERNKTRGKMITEQIMYKSKEDQEDAELRQVLNKSSNGNDEVIKGSITWRRQKSQPNTPTSTMYHNFQNNRSSTLNGNGTVGDGDDDEILESLVKTATRTSDTRVATRERKRNTGVNRNSTERKSLRRTLRHGLSEEERKMLADFMATGHTLLS